MEGYPPRQQLDVTSELWRGPWCFGALGLKGHNILYLDSFLEVAWLKMRVFKLSTPTIRQAEAFYVIICFDGQETFHLVGKIERA